MPSYKKYPSLLVVALGALSRSELTLLRALGDEYKVDNSLVHCCLHPSMVKLREGVSQISMGCRGGFCAETPKSTFFFHDVDTLRVYIDSGASF